MMDSALFIIVIALGISTILNLLFKRIGVSQIIGYILTGTILVYAFELRHLNDEKLLEHIAEFGIVFLMFTIGLEISFSKMKSMKKEIFMNGFLQVGITTLVAFVISRYLVGLDFNDAIILSLAFALSSTAVVLSYLKTSKDIYTPYGERSTGILIFQDMAVIPILIFLGFLTSDTNASIASILQETVLSAIFVIGLMMTLGKRVISWMLHFSATSEVDELFMGSVLFIVIGASIIASYAGFTYSLGAFISGMIIAETKYHRKVELDIGPFKDILLGTFFIVVGMKIDVFYFIENIGLVVGLFVVVFVIKTIITYLIIKISTNSSTSLKTALSLSQVGEFSFVIFSVAFVGGLLDKELMSLLILVVIFSMIVTPFFISRINDIVDYFIKEKYLESDITKLNIREDHVIVCGYSILGKIVTQYLDELGAPYVIIDNSPKHVHEALEEGKEAYLGDMSKPAILEALHAENSAAVIVTLDNLDKKRAICEAVLNISDRTNLIVKVASSAGTKALSDLNITAVVEAKVEVGRVLVERMISCQLKYK